MILELNDGVYTSDGSGSDGDIATWNGKEVWFHFASFLNLLDPQGSAVIKLPDSSDPHPLPPGWNCILHTSSPLNAGSASGLVQIKPLGGARLNHYWGSTHKYGRFANLSMQICRLSYNGTNEYALGGMSFHHNVPQSQRTLTNSSFAFCPIGPVNENEIIRVDVGACGGNVLLGIDPIEVWCPLSPVTNGHYPSYSFTVQKVDAASGGLLGIRQMKFKAGGGMEDDPAHPIRPSNDLTVTGLNRGYYYLRNKWDTVEFYIAADGVVVNKTCRESFATS